MSLFGTGSDSEIDDILAAPDAMTVNLDGEGGTGNFTYAISLGSGVLSTDLPRIGSDQIYEVWLIGESGPVPSGLFTPDDDGRAQILVEGVADGQLIGVTLEPAGGSPQPTGEILLLAEL